MTEDSTGASIPTFTAIDSAGPPQRKSDVAAIAARIPQMVNFLADRYGAYPFETVGMVADWVPDVGYTLENQTKPHFSGDEGGPAADSSTLAHELAHQWMGDSVTAANWSVIWFNEGWATFSEVLFDSKVDGADLSPKQVLRRGLQVEARRAGSWRPPCSTTIPPTCSTAWPSTTGRARCSRASARSSATSGSSSSPSELGERHGYGNISRGQFISEAKQASGLHGKKLKRLGKLLPPVAALGQAPAA